MKRFAFCFLLCLLSFSLAGCAPLVYLFGLRYESAETLNADNSEIVVEDVLDVESVGVGEDDGEADEPDAIADAISASGALCGALYVGYLDTESANLADASFGDGVLSAYPFLSDIAPQCFVDAGGCELYLIYPASKDVKITVHEWIIEFTEDDYVEKQGRELYRATDGQPILLRCNVSDIMSNSVVTVTRGNESKSFSPYISLKDGSTVLPDDGSVYDMEKDR